MPTDAEWGVIIDTIRSGECVPFLGAGASLGFGQVGLPTASALARDLAAFCDYQGSDREDFFRVSQYYESLAGRAKLRSFIINRLRVKGLRPARIHQVLAGLPLTHVLTTNYDQLMERAFEEEGKSPSVAFYNILTTSTSEVRTSSVSSPLVYKLHGTTEQPTSMLCTEDDLVNFLVQMIRNSPGLPSGITELFQNKSFLFIGYGLRDWNIRVIIRALRPVRDQIRSFAVQRKPDVPFTVDWLTSVMYFHRNDFITAVDEDALEFINELYDRFHNPVDRKSHPPFAAPHGAITSDHPDLSDQNTQSGAPDAEPRPDSPSPASSA